MKASYSGQLVGKALLLIWAILCVMFFIYIPSRVDFIHGFSIDNFPLTPQKFERIRLLEFIENLLGSFIIVILFSLACISFGSFFLKLILRNGLTQKKQTLPAWLAIIGTAFLLGHALFSIIFICLGILEKFRSVYIISTLATGFIVGFPSLKSIFFTSPIIKGLNVADELNGPTSKKFLYFSIGILLLGLLYSSSRLSYDAVAIYFSDEKLTALTNRIQYFQDGSFVASSFQAGISYAALITIFGDQAARMYPWVNGVVIVIFSLAIGEKVGLSKQARLITLLLLLTSTAFFDLTGDGKIDLISTATAIAAVYWAIGDVTNRANPTSFLIGILAGLAIASRPFNAFLVSLFIGVYYLLKICSRKDRQLSYIIKSTLWIGIGITCMIASHLFVNWAILGNPIAFLDNIQNVNSSTWQWTFDPNTLWVFRLFYPITLTIINLPQSNGNISPLFIAFLPGVLIKEIRERINISKELTETLAAAISTLILWITLLFTVFEIRYVLFLWIILFMAQAAVIEGFLVNNDLYLKKSVEFILVTLLMFISIRIIYIAIDTYSPIDEQGNPHCYDHDLCNLLEPINDMAAPGDRVLVLNAFRYYLRSDLLICSSKHEEYRTLQELSKNDQSAFWEEVYRQGYKYITYTTNFSQRHLGFSIVPGPDNTPDWLELKPIYGEPGEHVISYQIYVNDTSHRIEKTCKQNETGIWDVVDTKQ